MTSIIIVLSLFVSFPWPGGFYQPDNSAYATELPLNIEGLWSFEATLFQGVTQPKRDPDFIMEYEFKEGVNSRLMWTNLRRKNFCERRGRYYVKGNFLMEEVTWSNPNNSVHCSTDQDMQPNTQTTTYFEIVQGKLHLHLQLGTNSIIYIWKPVDIPGDKL